MLLALFAVAASAYALVRHYTRPEPAAAPAATSEIPAPEILPAGP